MWIGPRRLGWHPKDLEKKQSEELRESRLHRGMLLGWGVANLSPNPFSSQCPPHLPQGIAFSKGPRWPTLRNFALGALKEFGLGTQTIEERVLEEAACLLGDFQATGGTAWKKRGTICGRGHWSRKDQVKAFGGTKPITQELGGI